MEVPDQLDETTVNREISRAMVTLFKEYVGRGPSSARTYANEDVVCVVLEDTMIKAEQVLVEEGEEDLVRGVRRVFQGKFREDAIEIVERITGRAVRAFLSDHATEPEPDIAVEVFVLGTPPEAEA